MVLDSPGNPLDTDLGARGKVASSERAGRSVSSWASLDRERDDDGMSLVVAWCPDVVRLVRRMDLVRRVVHVEEAVRAVDRVGRVERA